MRASLRRGCWFACGAALMGSAEFMRSIARKGGLTTKARHGAQHFSEVGAMGGRAGKGKPRHKSPKKQFVPVAAPVNLSKDAVLQSIDDIIAEMEKGL